MNSNTDRHQKEEGHPKRKTAHEEIGILVFLRDKKEETRPRGSYSELSDERMPRLLSSNALTVRSYVNVSDSRFQQTPKADSSTFISTFLCFCGTESINSEELLTTFRRGNPPLAQRLVVDFKRDIAFEVLEVDLRKSST